MGTKAKTFYLLHAADADVREIWHYSANAWGEAQAERYLGALFNACEALGRNPNLGHNNEKLPSKLRVYHSAQHRIFYYLDADLVVITAFLHERQDMLVNLEGRI